MILVVRGVNSFRRSVERRNIIRSMYDLAIIGGGASGLVAAVRAAEYARTQHSIAKPSIVIFEATDKIGRPILRSGNVS